MYQVIDTADDADLEDILFEGSFQNCCAYKDNDERPYLMVIKKPQPQ